MKTEELNERAWDEENRKGNWWTRPVSGEEIEEARKGNLHIWLGPEKMLPESWTGRIGQRVLCLASGGGQQGPLLAATGRDVTVVDISERQLECDRRTAGENGLALKTVKDDMSTLSSIPSLSFDTVLNPVSLNFVSAPGKVFTQVSRVLKSGGTFMFSVANPAMYLFDVKALERGRMKIRYTLPFSSIHSLSERKRRKMERDCDTFEFSFTLDMIFSSLISSGFVIDGFFSEKSGFEPVDSFIQDCYLTVSATKTKDLSL